jgi:acetoin utilization protein AcuB
MSKSIPSVAEYMTPNPHSIALRQSLAQAYAFMREKNLRHLPVLAGDKLVGIIDDPDLRTFELLKGVDLSSLTVEKAMTPVPYSVTETTRLDEVAKVMAAHKYDVAVVTRDAAVVGVFTSTDAVRALADILHARP